MGSKSLTVAQYLVMKAKKPMTAQKLLKLCYIAHGHMLAKHGVPLLDEQVQAWQYGPFVKSVHHSIRDYGSMPVTTVHGSMIWTVDFTADEEAVMHTVLDNYAHFPAMRLSDATHQPGTPWSITRSTYQEDAPISDDLIKMFYREQLALPTHSKL
jgi:uncharacterized phage-associated protein